MGACLVVCAVGCGGNSNNGGSSGSGSGGSSGAGSSGSTGTGSGTSGSAGAGSGGNGSNGSCQTVTPCGGDVTGTWKITSTCLAPVAVDLGDAGVCPGEMLELSFLDYEGTVTFSAGSFNSTLTTGAVGETFTEPTSCLGQNTAATTCAELSAALLQNDAGATGGCSISGSNCVCSGMMMVAAQTSAGTYTTSGTSITLTTANSSNGPETDGYCVEGNTLYVDSSAASSMMGTTLLGGLVLTKQ